jgi:hypothetical protein
MAASQGPALLLLGGLAVAKHQRYLEAAADRGLAVLLIDAPGPYVDQTLASWPAAEPAPTGCAQLAPGDLTAVVGQIAAWQERYAIRGVGCLREPWVETASVVADLLALPGPGLRASRICRNKYLQRRLFASISPACTLVGPEYRPELARAWLRFPVVVKPIAREGSSGVRSATDPVTLADCLAGYDEREALLFEEYVPGLEYSVESLTERGELRFIGITAKRTTEAHSDYFVELAHTTPAPDLPPGDRETLLRTHRDVLHALRFDTGIAHAEYRVDAGGNVMLMEIAARPPGDAIMALHGLATGAYLEDALVALLSGETVTYPPPTRFARQVYLPQRPGLFAGIAVSPELGVAADRYPGAAVSFARLQPGAATDRPAVRRIAELKPRGSSLGPMRESSDRAATVIMDAPTAAELDELEARCLRAVRLRVVSRA